MKPSIRRILGFASILLHAIPSTAQTYSNCNPLTQGGCPADSALGRTVNVNFADGASDSFTAQGSPTYDSNGASFTIRQSGDSPQLTSKWYIMFGKVSVTLKAAKGTGIVSSVVLQSDCLDEIDWEWIGKDGTQVQTNYFGKGITGSYDRGAFQPNSGNQDGFITYTVDWTSEQIVWQINGQTVRALSASDAESGQYPQTPMQLKVGAWSGGDPSNSQGTIEWAGGNTDYSAGPYTMQVKSITVQDYSTGSSYEYSGTSGNWQDIKAVDGSVYSGSGSGTDSAAPAVTSVSTGQPIPFEGTHRSDDLYSTPSVYPWVPLGSTMSTATAAYTNYPGLPSGWTVTSSGKVVPPSSAPVSKIPLSNNIIRSVC
jgi:hypothetical protein